MREDLRERREDAFHLIYRMGVSPSKAVARLAEQYGCSESAVWTDLGRMGEWITSDELNVSFQDGVLRLAKVRAQHQELEQLALQARESGDLAEARRCREAIVSAIETENDLAQSLGLTNEMPTQVEVSGLDPKDEKLLDEWCRPADDAGLKGEPVDLDKWE